jgi:hypothetical protein
MLWTWPDLSHGLVEVASLATQAKIAGVLTEVLMGVLAVIWLLRWGIGRCADAGREGSRRGTATLAPSSPGRRMSALPPKADIAKHYWDLRFVPEADIVMQLLTVTQMLTDDFHHTVGGCAGRKEAEIFSRASYQIDQPGVID